MPDDRLYIKVHNGMPEHPKVVGLSDRAFRALVSLWCYCDRNNTDGKVPGVVALKESRKAVTELEKAGLLRPAGSDWTCHDFLEHQRSLAQKAALKEKRATAGAKGGQAKALASASRLLGVGHDSGASKSVAEKELEKEKDQTLAAKPRERDPIWDAVVTVCSINDAQITKSGRGPVSVAVRDLKAVGATAAQIQLRARNYRAKFPGAELTPTALAKHWASLEGGASVAVAAGGGW